MEQVRQPKKPAHRNITTGANLKRTGFELPQASLGNFHLIKHGLERSTVSSGDCL